MATVGQNTRDLVEVLKILAETSGLAKQSLENFGKTLEAFGRSRGVKDWETLSTAINAVTATIETLGGKSATVQRIRGELQELASQYRYFQNVPRSSWNKSASLLGQELSPDTSALMRRLQRMQELQRYNRLRGSMQGMQQGLPGMAPHVQESIEGYPARREALFESRAQPYLEQLHALQLVQRANREAASIDKERTTLAWQLVDIYETIGRETGRIRLGGGRVSGGKEIDLRREDRDQSEAQKRLAGYTSFKETFKEPGDFPGGERGIKGLTAAMKKYGLTQGVVTRNTVDMSSGIHKVTVKMATKSNVVKTATVYMNKYGTILKSSQRTLRTFGSSILNNTVKVLKWSIAMGLVYGPMSQFNKLLKESIEIQSMMADVQITLGTNTKSLNSVFREAGIIADETGSSVAGVVEGYKLAYAATGSIADPTERAVQAQILLKDSMVLSKLAGIDQATALDTLVAALSQLEMELYNGEILLDKWVAVSKNANVSIDTLASGFAIVGTSAMGAGIDVDKLNGMIAALAEATKLSADESGNAFRGFISGFQSAKAEKMLAQYGIAVRTTTGELRSFTDMVEELSGLADAGIISEREIGEISNVIGGGYRRGAQFAALLKNIDRAMMASTVSANAHGDAEEALAIRLETVKTAIQNLSNAFTELASTMGTEGGFLELITMGIKGLTLLVDVITAITDGLGKATPALTAFAAAMLFAKSSYGGNILHNMAMGIGGATLGPGAGYAKGDVPKGLAGAAGKLAYGAGYAVKPGGKGEMELTNIATTLVSIRNRLFGISGQPAGPLGGLARAGTSLKTQFPKFSPLGLIAPAMLMGGAAKEENWEKVATVFAGTVLGGLATGLSPLGLTLGSTAGASMYDYLTSNQQSFIERYTEIMIASQKAADKAAEEAGKPTVRTTEESRAERIKELDEIVHGTMSELQAGFLAFFRKDTGSEDIIIEAIEAAKKLSPEQLDARNRAAAMVGGTVITPDLIAALDELNTLIEVQLARGTGYRDTPVNKRTQAILENIGDDVEGAIEAYKKEKLSEYAAGRITGEAYIEAAETGKGMPLGTAGLMNIFEGMGAPKGAGEIVKTLTLISPDEVTRLTQYSQEILGLQATIDTMREEGKEGIGTYDEDLADLEELKAGFEEFWNAMQKHASVTNAIFLEIFELPATVTPAIFKEVEAKAQALYEADLIAMGNIPEDIKNIIESRKEELVKIEGTGFIDKTKIPEEYLKKVFHDCGIELGLAAQSTFSFRDMRKDITMEQVPGLMERYEQVKGAFGAYFPKYDIKEEDTGIITKNGFTTLHVDMNLMNLVLQDILDVNEQQLEGVWNLPKGMTAMIPWTSMYSRDVGGGGSIWDMANAFEKGTNVVEKDETLASVRTKIEALEARLAELHIEEGAKGEEVLPSIEPLLMKLESLKEMEIRFMEQQGITGMGEAGLDQPPTTQQLLEALKIHNKIEFNTNIRLTVDGRTLANVIKKYLYEDVTGAADSSLGSGSGSYAVSAE